jgi:hypothetical protein
MRLKKLTIGIFPSCALTTLSRMIVQKIQRVCHVQMQVVFQVDVGGTVTRYQQPVFAHSVLVLNRQVKKVVVLSDVKRSERAF